jgi:lysyl-tRNA synthetase class 2
VDWQPSAKIDVLRQRAELLARIRQFFSDRSVVEVETPILGQAGITDPSIEPLVLDRGESLKKQPRYLQTSPEYAMKRLLAEFGEPIYQITRAFRDGEAGSRHNPEFSLLEWYRPGFDHHTLMDEVADLIRCCLGDRPIEKHRYRELFLERLQVDPFTAPDAELQSVARSHLDVGSLTGGRDMWLDLILSHVLEPQFKGEAIHFVYDFPASQAALAQIVSDDGVEVGQRFEAYIESLELANGYCELIDAEEQRRRFEQDNALRTRRGQQERPVDERLLAALEHGLPACSGVALGIDRLLMLATGTADIREVLAFDWQRA